MPKDASTIGQCVSHLSWKRKLLYPLQNGSCGEFGVPQRPTYHGVRTAAAASQAPPKGNQHKANHWGLFQNEIWSSENVFCFLCVLLKTGTLKKMGDSRPDTRWSLRRTAPSQVGGPFSLRWLEFSQNHPQNAGSFLRTQREPDHEPLLLSRLAYFESSFAGNVAPIASSLLIANNLEGNRMLLWHRQGQPSDQRAHASCGTSARSWHSFFQCQMQAVPISHSAQTVHKTPPGKQNVNAQVPVTWIRVSNWQVKNPTQPHTHTHTHAYLVQVEVCK